jgi:hypothetical protein
MRKELYRFTEGENVWTYTSADEAEVYAGETYTPAAIGRSEAEQKGELTKANIDVSVAIDSDLGQRYVSSLIDAVVGLTIFVKDDEDVYVAWKGRLSIVKPERASIKLVFESVFTSLRRPGLRTMYQRSCPHVLYGRGCRLNKADFRIPAHLVSISNNGLSIIVNEATTYPNGTFVGGMIEDMEGNLRLIIDHYGPTLTLIRKLDGLAWTSADPEDINCYIYPGCMRTKEDCKNKFNNIDNYGGYPFIPLTNPFGGKAII